MPVFRHFTNMDLVVSRTDFDGDEPLLVFKCGAPLGKCVMNEQQLPLANGNLGHVHPDANHFVVYANGEYILKNNGYVRRITKYHNTLLVDGVGEWGDMGTYFNPWPIDALKNPTITAAQSAENVDYIVGDASNAYPNEVQLKKFIRKWLYIKDADMLVVYDSIASALTHSYSLLFFPESEALHLASSTLITGRTTRNAIRFENLTSAISTVTLTTETITDRSSPPKSTITPLIKISTHVAQSAEQVTAISWNKFDMEPAVASLSEIDGVKTVTVKGKSYKL